MPGLSSKGEGCRIVLHSIRLSRCHLHSIILKLAVGLRLLKSGPTGPWRLAPCGEVENTRALLRHVLKVMDPSQPRLLGETDPNRRIG